MYLISFSFQVVLRETAFKFHSFTKGRGLINQFTVALPDSWRGSDCLRSKSDDKNINLSRFDLVVGGKHPLFGAKPSSLQHGQCKVQGVEVQVPYQGLLGDESLNSNGEAELVLKEWIKYKFGVFEEHGFEGDEVYPLHYVEGEETKIARGCNETEEVILGYFLQRAFYKYVTVYGSNELPNCTSSALFQCFTFYEKNAKSAFNLA